MKGVNVVPFLELMGLPDSIVGILKNSESGNALTAYALYKIATPARYTVTLGGTSITVKYLRKHGYMSTPPPVKEYLQDRMEETKDKITEKMEETKDKITEKMEETKDKITEKIQETKDKVSFKKIKD
ncbi:protein FAM210A [Patagioenas fasciata monilis]|uniref:Protein FAM210A n=2 Tax=Patagioenas fasciata TaxID=372321 RepID=A0A1V4J8W4_PATFA|nr:protein FAM210A [Patagioenas fasciata monilis]